MANVLEARRLAARQDLEKLHQGLVVDLDRRFSRPEEAKPDRPAASRGDVDSEVATTISVIQQAAAALAELQETIRSHEEALYDQRQTIAELQHTKTSAYQELAAAERILKSERERADRAESRAQNLEAQTHQLDERCNLLTAHLNSLMGTVRDTLSPAGKASAMSVAAGE